MKRKEPKTSSPKKQRTILGGNRVTRINRADSDTPLPEANRVRRQERKRKTHDYLDPPAKKNDDPVESLGGKRSYARCAPDFTGQFFQGKIAPANATAVSLSSLNPNP